VTRRAWVLFVAVSVLFGFPYLFIKLAVGELSPPVVVVARTGLATLVLLPVALRRGAFRGLRGKLRWLVAVSLLEVVTPFLLIAVGEQYVASSLAGLLIAAEPLFVALLALRFDASERVGGLRLGGLLLGFAGVACLLGLDVSGDRRQFLGALAILAAAACYGSGALLVKRRFADTPPLGVVTGAMLISSVVLAPVAAATAPSALPSGSVVAALVLLAVPCTAIAFLAFFGLIAAAGASRATVVAYLNPAVAGVLGVLVLSEPVTATMVAGFLLVIAGSWLATGGTPPTGLTAVVVTWRRSWRPAWRRPAAAEPAECG
jgi:drug/metabolite transporter (DMT)-like permease